jgi:transposase InsO family protein
MIRDMMVQCVERRFASVRAPHKIQWLTDNGSIFAASKTVEIALALNLEPCFTPVESPESNGMAEAFVKTFKRDYVRVTALPDADTALAMLENWMEPNPKPPRVRSDRVNSRIAHRRVPKNGDKRHDRRVQPTARLSDLDELTRQLDGATCRALHATIAAVRAA